MEIPRSNNRLTCPLLVVSPNTEHFLAANTARGLRLPAIDVPSNTRLAAGLTASTTQVLGTKSVHLFSVDSALGGPYRVMQSVSEKDPIHPPWGWKFISAVSAANFADQADYAALASAVSRPHGIGDAEEPFSTLGWFAVVEEWVRRQADRSGFTLTGEFEQWNAAPAFSLIRFTSDKAALWFKAVGGPNTCEFSITDTLSGLFPSSVCEIIARNPIWRAWVSREAEGSCLEDICAPDAWQQVATRLADLQIASLPHTAAILNAGAANWAISELADQILPLIDHGRILMAEQHASSPAPLSESDLSELEEQLQNSISRAAQVGPPAALGHLDLNPGNVFVTRQGACTFLDWADGYVGYPFATFEYLMQHFRRLEIATHFHERRIQDAYWSRWDQQLSQDQVFAFQKLTPLLAVLMFAVHVTRRLGRDCDVSTAGFVRSLLRRMKREADLLAPADVALMTRA